jgi:hypothetical protein
VVERRRRYWGDQDESGVNSSEDKTRLPSMWLESEAAGACRAYKHLMSLNEDMKLVNRFCILLHAI